MTDNTDKLATLLSQVTSRETSPEFHTRLMKKIHQAESLATLGTTLGAVYLEPKRTSEPRLAQSGEALFAGDRILTRKTGKTYILFKDGTQLWLNQESTLVIGDTPRQHQLPMGELLAFVTRAKTRKDRFILKTPSALVEVLGTEFDIAITPDRSSLLTVLRGRVQFQNDKGKLRLKSNYQSAATPSQEPSRPQKVKALEKIQWTQDLTLQAAQEENNTLPETLTHPERFNNTFSLGKTLLILAFTGILGYLLGYLYGMWQ